MNSKEHASLAKQAPISASTRFVAINPWPQEISRSLCMSFSQRCRVRLVLVLPTGKYRFSNQLILFTSFVLCLALSLSFSLYFSLLFSLSLLFLFYRFSLSFSHHLSYFVISVSLFPSLSLSLSLSLFLFLSPALSLIFAVFVKALSFGRRTKAQLSLPKALFLPLRHKRKCVSCLAPRILALRLCLAPISLAEPSTLKLQA